jgi:hypothetical protein
MPRPNVRKALSDPDTLLRTDGTTSAVRPTNGKDYGLEELYTLLGCEIVEVIRTAIPGVVLICDEEGLYKNPPLLNAQASILAGQQIVGNALACDTRRFK